MSEFRSRNKTRGQALAEFALVAPILFLMFFGIIEFGRFILAYTELNNATREGARYAIVHGSSSLCPTGPMPGGNPSPLCDDTAGTAVKNVVVRSGVSLHLSTSQVTVTWSKNNVPNQSNARNNDVTVVADYAFTTIIPLPLPPIGMTARSTLVINH